MLDEEWLKSLKFEISDNYYPRGCRIDGITGTGNTGIVFIVIDPNGEKFCLKIYHQLGFFLKEIPPWLTKETKYYNIDRINQKLYTLTGNPLIDDICEQYNRLYSYLIKYLYEIDKVGDRGVIQLFLTDILNDESAFILHSIKRRLNNLAFPPPKPEDYSLMGVDLIEFNTPFPCIGERKRIINWAKSSIESINKLIQLIPCLKAESSAVNPLYIWGAAVMDSLVTEEVIPDAITFIKEKYGNLVEHPQVDVWMNQVSSFAHLYIKLLGHNTENDLESHRIKKFVKFCSMAGYFFPLPDKKVNMLNENIDATAFLKLNNLL